MKVLPHAICSALDEKTIGSKVINHGAFMMLLEAAIAAHDTSEDGVPGQHKIRLHAFESVEGMVSSGVGHRSDDPDHYVLRHHRESVSAYLKREFAPKAARCTVIVYDAEATRKDPDTTSADLKWLEENEPTHIIVAVLATPDEVPDPPPYPVYRLVHNLAGGNNEAETWTVQDIKRLARASKKYADTWVTVAD